MSKRVHEIAKERGVQPKELLAQLQAAGLKVKAVSSSVDEAEARRVLDNGGGSGNAAPAVPAAPADGGPQPRAAQRADGGGERSQRPRQGRSEAPAARAETPPPGSEAPAARTEGRAEATPRSGSDAQPRRNESDTGHKRPTRDSLQGERAPGNAGGRRRVVIDSQASRRNTGGPPAQTNQPPRRQRRGRRRRGVYDEEAESRPSSSNTALAEPDATRIPSGSTVKDVAEYLDVPVPE